MKTYLIDFGGNVFARITVENDVLQVTNAMNGYGGPISLETVQVNEEVVEC